MVDSCPSPTEVILTFAPLAGERIVVITGRPITAHQTQFLLLPRGGSLLLLLRIVAVRRVAVETAGGRQILTTCKSEKNKKQSMKHRKQEVSISIQ